MDIKSWKIMLAVDDYGSFTRVGAELGYTQSGITQMMKNLEKKVGFPLYIKDHHGITLTNEAKSLIPAIRTLLNADEVIHQEIAALNGAQRGTIRIGTYLSCSIHWIPKIIREFQQKHPDIRYVTRNEFSSLSMVEHELGYSILPGLLLRGQQGKFVKRPLKPTITRQLGLAYSSLEDLSPASKTFLEYAKNFLLDD